MVVLGGGAVSYERDAPVQECIGDDGKMTALLNKLRDSGKKNFKLASAAKKSIMELLLKPSQGFYEPQQYYSVRPQYHKEQI